MYLTIVSLRSHQIPKLFKTMFLTSLFLFFNGTYCKPANLFYAIHETTHNLPGLDILNLVLNYDKYILSTHFKNSIDRT